MVFRALPLFLAAAIATAGGMAQASPPVAPAPTTSSSDAVANVGHPQRLEGVNPARILDTRLGIGAPATKVGPGGTVDVQVTGEGGVPESGVAAVVLNVTVTDPSAPGYVTAWPSGETRPEASNLNFVAGQTIPNLVIVKVGQGGKVSLFNAFGETHLLADVSAYYTDDAQLVPLSPQRLLDTRQTGGPVSGTTTIQVTGDAGVPDVGASAVIMNVTVVEPTRAGFITVWPHGESRPDASNLNFAVNETRPNLVISKLGDEGKVDLRVSTGSAHVLIDVFGYIEAPVKLTDILSPVDSGCSGTTFCVRPRNRLDIDGTAYFHSLGGRASTTSRWTEYNLGRQWTSLSTTIGHSDGLGVSGSRMRFRIIGDGDVLADHALDFGETLDLDIDVTGILRIRFEITRITRPSGTFTEPYGVFADPELSR